MKTGELIRTLRKEKKLTQEQVADMLGVSAPAVNKWENGNSMPDVALLAPLARLLDTDINTLLNFQEELSETELAGIGEEISMKLIKSRFEEAFAQGEEYLRKYPGCGQLCLQLGSIYNGAAVMAGEANQEWKERFTKKGQELLDYAAKSQDRAVADKAAYYNVINAINQEDFPKAELLLSQIPETYIRKEDIYPGFYLRQEKYEEASACLEERMLSQGAALLTNMDMYTLACLKLGEQERAEQIARLYYQTACMLNIPGLNPYSSSLTLALEGSKTEKSKEALQEQREETWQLLEQFVGFFMNSENVKYENSILFQNMEQPKKQEEGEFRKTYGAIMEHLLDAMENKEDGAFLREDEKFEERLRRLKEMCKQEET